MGESWRVWSVEQVREWWTRRKALTRNATRRWQTKWGRRRARARAWWRGTWPGLWLWASVLGGWGLVTWAVVDAVPQGWEPVAWKASGGLLLVGLVGWQTWRRLLGMGVHVLREMDERNERRR